MDLPRLPDYISCSKNKSGTGLTYYTEPSTSIQFMLGYHMRDKEARIVLYPSGSMVMHLTYDALEKLPQDRLASALILAFF
jgi:hypothetical protein